MRAVATDVLQVRGQYVVNKDCDVLESEDNVFVVQEK